MTPTVEAIPYFHALAVFACKGNRLYRVYIRPDELVFIWAGSGTEGMAGAASQRTHGVIGYLVSQALTSAMDPSKKNETRRAVLDSTPLDQLIRDNPKNVRGPIGGF